MNKTTANGSPNKMSIEGNHMIGFAERHRHHRPTMRDAVAYLVSHGYIQCKGAWLRGLRETALIEPLVTGRYLVREGVGV